MTATVAEDDRRLARPLADASPLVLLVVALPWLLEDAVVRGVSLLAPGYRSLVTQGLLDAILYPVLTGSVVLVGLYLALDPAARASVFPTMPSRRELLVVPVMGVLTAVVGFVATGVAMAVLGAEGGASAFEGGIDASWVVVYVVTAVVFAPLVEETLFRGLFLGYLLDRDVSPVAAGAVVAVAFGAIHLYDGPARAVGAVAIGAVLVGLRLRYDGVAVPVGAHAVTNLVMGALGVAMAMS